jgi:rod shape-determining protein MreC
MHVQWTTHTDSRAAAARMSRQRRFTLAAGVLLSLVSLALWGNSSGGGPVAQTLARGLHPLRLFEQSLTRSLTGGGERLQDLRRTASRLAEVRQRNLELEALLAEKELVSTQNRFLRESLGLTGSITLQVLPARVIGRNQTGVQSLVVDLGSNEGIKPFDPVFRPEGAVGYVVQTLGHSSLVLLLTDRNARLGVSIVADASGESIEGRTRGLPDGTHLLLQTKSPEPITAGCRVVTSGLSTIFFPGVLVGSVKTRIPLSGGLFDEYVVVPAVDLHRLDWVLVLKGTYAEESMRLLDPPRGRERGGIP